MNYYIPKALMCLQQGLADRFIEINGKRALDRFIENRVNYRNSITCYICVHWSFLEGQEDNYTRRAPFSQTSLSGMQKVQSPAEQSLRIKLLSIDVS